MSSLFSNPSGGSSLFGQNNNQQQQQQQQQQNSNTNPFGASTNNNQQKPSLFESLNTNAATSQATSGGSLFGSTSQPQQSGGSLFGQTAQPQQSGTSSLFGNLGATTTPQNQQNQQSGSSLFGNQQQQPTKDGGGLFGGLGTTNNQQNQSQQGGLFVGFGQNAQQQQPQQQQAQTQNQQPSMSLFGQTQQGLPKLYVQDDSGYSVKSVTGQIQAAYNKWNPQSPETAFSTYLYNNVPIEQAPFYGPTPIDNEASWEEALKKKPRPGAIPILAQGFQGLGQRMKMQYQALTMLQGRLHEINEGLSGLLKKHDLEISVRAAECRRKHLRTSQRCLTLAARTQILRNRGYAMDSAEEDLRKRLLVLERKVFDPALNGRGEEIWARMVSVRERTRQLQRELERSGMGLAQDSGKILDDDVMAKTKKILEDYSSQIAHLTKEMTQMQKDWAEWQSSQPNGVANGRR